MSSRTTRSAESHASPSATGPAGSLLEGEVGAHYLLTMLDDADPRGLPGTRVDQVEWQRAGEGHPFDDAGVRAATSAGQPAVLEMQAKRTITFAPKDDVFRDVVGQLARALPTLDLSHERHQFAVATTRTSAQIEGPYRDVLRWAREVGSASVFMDRVRRPKVGNDAMRGFVDTLARHLEAFGAPHDDETLWNVLRRFQILTFDFDAVSSQARDLALERARSLLYPADAAQAGALWSGLIEISMRAGASGGDRDPARLRDELLGAGFRLQGSRRNQAARKALADAAEDAVADLRPSLAGTKLSRGLLLDRLRAAMDQGRYVEIRGEPGVGKSGLLGTLAAEVLTEGCALMLTPERTVPGGWLALRDVLGTADGARAFLCDLASDGGATLFVDGLDSFADPARRATVVDLVRAAGGVPGFRVVVTARSDFDRIDSSWLPSAVLDALGRAPTVVVEDLDAAEVQELRTDLPALRAVLADDHPARAILRNPFRLALFLGLPSSTEALQSEIDLLERWWSTAEGTQEGRRDRLRLLTELGTAALDGHDRLETRAPSTAVDALVARGTLRDLGAERVAFGHDVLRDWTVAKLLHLDPDRFGRLALDRPAPSSLARGVELAARLALERNGEGLAWADHLARVCGAGAHRSWRRWSLLAVLRSEVASALLDRVDKALLDQNGALLRELIRTALAVESRPLADLLAAAGVEVPAASARLFVPSNGSWVRLAIWLLARRADLPPPCLIDVVELFQSLSASMGLQDPLTPLMADALADWLEEIEAEAARQPGEASPARFADSLDGDEWKRLVTALRDAFFLMAPRTPERVQAYLRGLVGRRSLDRVVRQVKVFGATLAQAAPAELADLMLAALIQEETGRRDSREPEPFTHLDYSFHPASPAQGPFLALLETVPEHGLRLIRGLVGHAVATLSEGRDAGEDGFLLPLPDGTRFFPWQRTYGWTRHADGHWAVESGLLAIEAWAHARIERGDSPEAVVADVLGPPGSPAAFLLVAVDVVISHWPKTGTAALPLLGCPELLATDRMRPEQEALMAIGLSPFEVEPADEPAGRIRLADLRKRPSRRLSLESLLDEVTHATPDLRVDLQNLLDAACSRLGPPQPGDDFGVPRFLARHALNRLDPANWRAMEGGWTYVSPPEEARHLEKLRAEREPDGQDWPTEIAIRNVVEQPGRSGPDLAARAVAFAQRRADAADDDRSTLKDTVVSAAMILARDGDDALLDQHEAWAREIFNQALVADDRHGSEARDRLLYNPAAIATLGLIHLLRRRGRHDDRDRLLRIAGSEGSQAAPGFGAGAAVLRALDPRLLPAILRCALTAQVRPRSRWRDPEHVQEVGERARRERVDRAVRSEVAWLDNGDPEPAWPGFPDRRPPERRFIRIGGADERSPSAPASSDDLLTTSAARWVRTMTRDAAADDLPWVEGLVESYAPWTVSANGAGLEEGAGRDLDMGHWNATYCALLARVAERMGHVRAAVHVGRLVDVPEEPLFDLAAELARSLDQQHFDGQRLGTDLAVRLRSLVAERLRRTSAWRREHGRSDLSFGRRSGAAIASLFFNEFGFVGGARCYLLPPGVDRIDPFLPGLSRLIEDGPVPLMANLAMNLLEVSPRPSHLPFLLSSATAWLDRQPRNIPLWVDHGLGARVARWIEAASGGDPATRLPNHPFRPAMDDVLARLVSVGVAEAHRVETLVASASGSDGS